MNLPYIIESVTSSNEEVILGAFAAQGDAYVAYKALRDGGRTDKSIQLVKKSRSGKLVLFHHNHDCPYTQALLKEETCQPAS